jgi:hypothetical protein
MRIYFYFPLARQTNLCHEIARYWQETRCWRDFAGVIVVSEGPTYQFMQKQTEVPYHYLDPIRDVDNAALDYQVTPARLKTWEQRLDCPLWHLAVADRQIGRVFVKGGPVLRTAFASQATHENIARLICYYLDFYQKRLESFRPDAVFFPVLAAMHALALAKVCQWMEIPFFTLRHTRVLDHFIIVCNETADRLLAVEKRFHELLAQPQNAPPLSEEAKHYFESFQEVEPDLSSYVNPTGTFHQKMRQKNPLRFWGGIGYRFVNAAHRWLHYQELSKHNLRLNHPLEEWWLETRRIVGIRYAHTPHVEPSGIGKEPYVYYPLHLDPESATMVFAPNFVNQLTLIEVLAKNIPLTHKLYVKEHPAMLGRRRNAFYRALKEYPNVRLMPITQSSLDLIRHADLVAVITGTAGWEALLTGRSVITFGDCFHTVLDASEKCSDFDLLGDQIYRLIFEKENYVDQRQVLLFLAALFEQSFSLSTRVLWQKDLHPGQLDNETQTTVHKVADRLATTIETYYAEQRNVIGSEGRE